MTPYHLSSVCIHSKAKIIKNIMKNNTVKTCMVITNKQFSSKTENFMLLNIFFLLGVIVYAKYLSFCFKYQTVKSTDMFQFKHKQIRQNTKSIQLSLSVLTSVKIST